MLLQHHGPGLVVRGTHAISLEPPASAASVWRPLADRIFAKPHALLASGSLSSTLPKAPTAVASDSTGSSVAIASSAALLKPLPPNVALMTLVSLSPGQLLLRLAHQFGIGEDATLSKPASVDLSALFDPSALKIKTAREVSLTNNQNKTAILARRREAAAWRRDGAHSHPWRHAGALDYAASSVVTLGPLEIKTFVLDVFA